MYCICRRTRRMASPPRILHGLSVEQNFPARRPDQSHHCSAGRGLSAAGFPHQAYRFARVHRQAHPSTALTQPTVRRNKPDLTGK